MFKNFSLLLFLIISACGAPSGISQPGNTGLPVLKEAGVVITGAEQTDLYFPALSGLNVAVVCNHTSLVDKTHLVDTLVRAGIRVRSIFSPEHGFRGQAEAGAEIRDGVDPATGIPVISLYGSQKKPDAQQLSGVDVVVFDIQDVGARFYTYISTLSLVMEACAENGVPLIVLDRPNPNGFYIDGPVLDTAFRSFVGMHPVPVIYGMTIGEYATMANGEGWLAGGVKCSLTIIPLKGYDRNMIVKLPVRPSPNLPTWQSIYLYPSLCLFEGTAVSVGRGTDYPFEVIGHPELKSGTYYFKPEKIPGVAENPPFSGVLCNGQLLRPYAEDFKGHPHHFSLSFLMDYYRQLSATVGFFNSYFEKLAGNGVLRRQIMEGLTEQQIRSSWEDGLAKFRAVREKYLLYPDF